MDGKNILSENSKNLINFVYQSCNNIVLITRTISKKTSSESFKEHLEKNASNFLKIINDCFTLSKEHNINLQDINIFKKTKLKTLINLNIILDNTTENLAKIILVNMNENIINLIKQLDCCPNSDEEIKKVALTLNKLEEKFIHETKKFLLKDPTSYGELTIKQDTNKKVSAKSTKKKTAKNNHD